MTSNYARAFLKSDEKDGLRETTGGTKNAKVCQVVFGEKSSAPTATKPCSRISDTDMRKFHFSYVPRG